jgi:catechol 2,3-dioxygenase-like lactoylglutathione lyase family enzyme
MDLLVNIDVDDLEKAVAFYGSAFGLAVGRRFGTFGVEMLGASSAIHLLRNAAGTRASPSTSQRRRYTRHWTPLHLDVVVDDIEAAVDKAVSAGARLEQAVAVHAWGKHAVLADPFGHGFCFIEFLGRGYDELAAPGAG